MKTASTDLYTSSPIGLRAQTTTAVDETLRRGLTTLVLGLDSLPSLDDAVVSAAIRALRRLREVGGTVELVTERPEHRRYLEMTGLDRVFDVFANTAEADASAQSH